VITSAPDSFKLGRQVSKVFEDRKLMAAGEIPINWGFAESMAYATLLSEGYPIRLTGQDVRRGTFHIGMLLFITLKMELAIYH
jgi:2-oxoglutarate dehydrogenase E1 component